MFGRTEPYLTKRAHHNQREEGRLWLSFVPPAPPLVRSLRSYSGMRSFREHTFASMRRITVIHRSPLPSSRCLQRNNWGGYTLHLRRPRIAISNSCVLVPGHSPLNVLSARHNGRGPVEARRSFVARKR